MAKILFLERRVVQLAGGAYVTVMVAGDPYTDEQLEGLTPGQVYKAELKTDRSRGDLNLYWAGLGLLQKTALSEEEDLHWPTSRHLHEMLLDALGYTIKLWRVDGTYRKVVDSIALEKMDDADFKILVERVKAVVLARWGIDPWSEWKAIKDNEAAKKQGWQRNWRPGDTDAG